jgi:hypothetical protein
MGYSLEKAGKEVLGSASKVVIRKDSTLIVTDGSSSHAVEKRVAMIKEQIEVVIPVETCKSAHVTFCPLHASLFLDKIISFNC